MDKAIIGKSYKVKKFQIKKKREKTKMKIWKVSIVLGLKTIRMKKKNSEHSASKTMNNSEFSEMEISAESFSNSRVAWELQEKFIGTHETKNIKSSSERKK